MNPSHLSEDEKAHRRAFRDYVLAKAEPWHRAHLGRLYEDWTRYNGRHFAGALVEPYILLAEPSNPRRYADCGTVSGFGGKSQIRLRPSLLAGTHPDMRPGEGYADGRGRFVTDVLLHEMVHQWQHEVSGDTDRAYHGHGPAFRDMANAIGAKLGIDPVRTCKARGADADRASCSYWPHIVRPAGYYLGAYRHHERHCVIVTAGARDVEPDAATIILPADPAGLGMALARLYGDAELVEMLNTLSGTLCDAGRALPVPASGDVRFPFPDLAADRATRAAR